MWQILEWDEDTYHWLVIAEEKEFDVAIDRAKNEFKGRQISLRREETK